MFCATCPGAAYFCTETGGAYQRSHAIMIWSRALYPRVFHTSAHVGEAILGTGTVLQCATRDGYIKSRKCLIQTLHGYIDFKIQPVKIA